ncbi:MAG: two-component system, OmpR family, response regulator [Acidimicrobiaceae bacterium]|nr:two-component system, OmpR family, response regulator [Acidimicrobiaceae bacterium]
MTVDVHAAETGLQYCVRTVLVVDVVLVRWPLEAERRERLADAQVPRLLLIEDGGNPPEAADCLEDWVHVPASEVDVRARVGGLAARAARHISVAPRLDDDGVLRFGTGWVSLPPVEARLTTALLERFGAVVTRDALGRAGWPTGAPGRNALDVHVLRLRRRLSPLSLAIRTVRSRGYLLEATGAERAVASDA